MGNKSKLQKKAQEGSQNLGIGGPPASPNVDGTGQTSQISQTQNISSPNEPWKKITVSDALFPFIASWWSQISHPLLDSITKGWFSNSQWDPESKQWIPRPPSGSKIKDLPSNIARRALNILTNPWYLLSGWHHYRNKKKEYEEKLKFYREIGIDKQLTEPSWLKSFLEEGAKFALAEGLAYFPQKGWHAFMDIFVKKLRENRKSSVLADILSSRLVEAEGTLAKASRVARAATAIELFVPGPHNVLLALGFDMANYLYKALIESTSWEHFQGMRRLEIQGNIERVADIGEELTRRGWYNGLWTLLSYPFPSLALLASSIKELSTGNWQKASYLLDQAMTVAFPTWLKDSLYVLTFGSSEYRKDVIKQHTLSQLGHMYVTGPYSIQNLTNAVSRISSMFSTSSISSSGDTLENISKAWATEKHPFSYVHHFLTSIGVPLTGTATGIGGAISGGPLSGPNILLSGSNMIYGTPGSAQIITPAEAEKAIIEAARGGRRYIEVIENNKHWSRLADARLDLRRLITLSQRFNNAIELLEHNRIGRLIGGEPSKVEQLADKTIVSLLSSFGKNEIGLRPVISRLEMQLRHEIRGDKNTLKDYMENIFDFGNTILDEYRANVSRERIDDNIKKERLRVIDEIKQKLSERKKYFSDKIEKNDDGVLTEFVFWLFDESKEDGFSKLMKNTARLSLNVNTSNVNTSQPLDIDHVSSEVMMGKFIRYQAYRSSRSFEKNIRIKNQDGTINREVKISTNGVSFTSKRAQLYFDREVALLQAKAMKSVTEDVILDTLRDNVPPAEKAYRLLAASSVYQVSGYDPIQVMAVNRLMDHLTGIIRRDPSSDDSKQAQILLQALVDSGDDEITSRNIMEVSKALAVPQYFMLRNEKGERMPIFKSPIEGVSGGLTTIIANINKNQKLQELYQQHIANITAQLLRQDPNNESELLMYEYIAAAMTVAAIDRKLNEQNVLYALNGRDFNGQKVDLDGRRLIELSSNREFLQNLAIGKNSQNGVRFLAINFGGGIGAGINVLHIVSPEAEDKDQPLMRILGSSNYSVFRSLFADIDDIKRLNMMIDQWRRRESYFSKVIDQQDQLVTPRARRMEAFLNSIEHAIKKEEEILQEEQQKPEYLRGALHSTATIRVKTLKKIHEHIKNIYTRNKYWIETDEQAAKDFNKIFAYIAVSTAAKEYMGAGGELVRFLRELEDHFGLLEDRPYSSIILSEKARKIYARLLIENAESANFALANLIRGSGNDFRKRSGIAGLAVSMMEDMNFSTSALRGLFHTFGQETPVDQSGFDPYDPHIRGSLYSALVLAAEMRKANILVPGEMGRFLDLILVTDPSGGPNGKPKHLTFTDIEERFKAYNERLQHLDKIIAEKRIKGENIQEDHNLMLELAQVRQEYIDFYKLISSQVKHLEDTRYKPSSQPGTFNREKDAANIRLAILRAMLDKHGVGLTVISNIDLRYPQIRKSQSATTTEQQ